MAEFDQNPLVLNCANGTLFLLSMDFAPTTAGTDLQRYLVLIMTRKQKAGDGIDSFMKL
uniref:hypothetical protein n=1 Tax=Rubeoparvulum massiliense TaxID=1631346 RepID=UPI002F42A7F5